MASMTEITCICGCKRKRMVRNADIKRGWGKYFNKSCKARKQHQTMPYHPRVERDSWDEYVDGLHPFSSEALGQW